MSSSTLKVWVGVAAAAIVLLVGARWAFRSGDGSTGSPATEPDGTKQSDRVRQRLEELRTTHPGAGQETGASQGKTGKIEAREGVMPRSQRNMQFPAHERPAGQAAKGDAQPQDAPESAPIDDDIEDIPTLKNLALQDPDPERRLTAVTMLGATEDPQAIPILAQALSDQDEEVRMAALEGLSDFTDEPPVEAIENAINDPSADIRFEAVSVLSDIGGDRARSAIEKALNDPDDDVRTLAEGILDMEETYEGTPGGGETPAPAQPPGMAPHAGG
jgi:hypothetical protein